MSKQPTEREGVCPRCSGTRGRGRAGIHIIGTTPHCYSEVEESWFCTRCGDRHELRVVEGDDPLEALLLTPEQEAIFRAGRVRGLNEAEKAIAELNRSAKTGTTP